MIYSEYQLLDYSKDKEKKKELFNRFTNIMKELNLKNIWNEDDKKKKDEEEKYESICERYANRFKEINQEVAENELFLFSILTGRIKMAKVFWKRGKVRSFKNTYYFRSEIFIRYSK